MTSMVDLRNYKGLDVARLDSPANRNALSIAVLGELTGVVERSQQDDRSRGLILDHTGPVFCSGVDLRERRELDPGDDRHSQMLADLLERLWAYPKPVLCRVDGAVRGGGMGLVACADIVVASSAASFAYSEVRVGVAPALVASIALLKVPTGQLLPWLLTGEKFSADQAKEMGLVSYLADGDDSVSLVDDVADGVLRAAPGASMATKRITRTVAGLEDVGELLEEMGRMSAELFATDEAREGMAAFAEKRQPAWVQVSPW